MIGADRFGRVISLAGSLFALALIGPTAAAQTRQSDTSGVLIYGMMPTPGTPAELHSPYYRRIKYKVNPQPIEDEGRRLPEESVKSLSGKTLKDIATLNRDLEGVSPKDGTVSVRGYISAQNSFNRAIESLIALTRATGAMPVVTVKSGLLQVTFLPAKGQKPGSKSGMLRAIGAVSTRMSEGGKILSDMRPHIESDLKAYSK